MFNSFIGPHGHDFTPVAETLEPYRDEEIVFVPGPGNAGDGLINLGTYKFLERLKIRHRWGDYREPHPGKVVLHCGGGALVSIYPGSEDILRRNADVAKALILLPHTVRTHGEYLKSLGANCTLFAREAISYEYLLAHRGAADVKLAPDMAFVLSDRDISTEPWGFNHLWQREILGPWARMLIKFLWRSRKEKKLRAMRSDKESKIIMGGDSDMTGMFSPGNMHRDQCANAIKAIRLIAKAYDEIETDRLHMSILAAIMGKKVTLFDNSYGKNKSMFEASMRDYFPHMNFRDA